LWAAGFCRDVFLEFLQQHPPVHQRIAQVARERHSQTSAYGEQLASLASVEGLIARLRQALT
jgi:CRP-like cAMP-binding protein